MITELARIRIKPNMKSAFLAAVTRSVPLFQAAKGYISVSLSEVEEDPLLFMLLVEWETLEDHTVTFRNSAAFQTWRENVSPYFDGTPEVLHLRTCITPTAPQAHM